MDATTKVFSTVAREKLGPGWTAKTKAGIICLRYCRMVKGVSTDHTKSLGLPSDLGQLEAFTRAVEAIAAAVAAGTGAIEAIEAARPKQDSQRYFAGINWERLQQDFLRDREISGNRIGPKTLAAERRYTSQLIEAAKAGATTGAELFKAAFLLRYADNYRTRKIAIEASLRMIRFGAETNENLAVFDLSPLQKRRLVGKAPAKKEKPTLSDSQIIQLIEAQHSSQWKNALALMATFGLRPEELNHLSVRTNHETGERQLWCSYEKASGNHRTKQRWLYPVWLTNMDGERQFTNVVAAFDAGLISLPMLNERNKAAVCTQLSQRTPLWRQWKAELADKGMALKPYALRDSYSLRCHLKGLNAGTVARMMGHSLSCHSASYVWATAESVSQEYSIAMV